MTSDLDELGSIIYKVCYTGGNIAILLSLTDQNGKIRKNRAMVDFTLNVEILTAGWCKLGRALITKKSQNWRKWS